MHKNIYQNKPLAQNASSQAAFMVLFLDAKLWRLLLKKIPEAKFFNFFPVSAPQRSHDTESTVEAVGSDTYKSMNGLPTASPIRREIQNPAHPSYISGRTGFWITQVSFLDNGVALNIINISCPSLRTRCAVFPWRALQSVVSWSGLTRQSMGFWHCE